MELNPLNAMFSPGVRRHSVYTLTCCIHAETSAIAPGHGHCYLRDLPSLNYGLEVMQLMLQFDGFIHVMHRVGLPLLPVLPYSVVTRIGTIGLP